MTIQTSAEWWRLIEQNWDELMALLERCGLANDRAGMERLQARRDARIARRLQAARQQAPVGARAGSATTGGSCSTSAPSSGCSTRRSACLRPASRKPRRLDRSCARSLLVRAAARGYRWRQAPSRSREAPWQRTPSSTSPSCRAGIPRSGPTGRRTAPTTTPWACPRPTSRSRSWAWSRPGTRPPPATSRWAARRRPPSAGSPRPAARRASSRPSP